MSVAEPADDLTTADDDRVMEGVTGGSAAAFGVLYDRYCDRAYRIARSVCRDNGDAEDAVQEAFISIWRTRGTYAPHRGRVAAWVLAVVRHRAVDIARRNGPHPARRAQDPVALLAHLPDAQQEAVTLGFYGQLSYSEIAVHLGVAPATVKGRMRVGLERLRGDVERIAPPRRGWRAPPTDQAERRA